MGLIGICIREWVGVDGDGERRSVTSWRESLARKRRRRAGAFCYPRVWGVGPVMGCPDGVYKAMRLSG